MAWAVASNAKALTTFCLNIFKQITIPIYAIFLYTLVLYGVIATLVAYRVQDQLIASHISKVDLQQSFLILDDKGALRDAETSLKTLKENRNAISCENNIDSCSKLDKQINEKMKLVDGLGTSIDAQKRLLGGTDDTNKKLFNLASELKICNLSIPGTLTLALAPMAMITLVLCIAMGTLGSAIHMTQEYLKDDSDKSLSWYVLRPFLGIMLAVATFILFKSGQVVLTVTPGANGSETDSTLNPFVVSFVAVISGLLSEHAYRRISDAGSQLLAAKDAGISRWIRPSVAAAVPAKAESPGKVGLERFFPDVDKETIQDWLSGKRQVSAADQTVIAAWLDMPACEAFTDQPPPRGNENTKPVGGAENKGTDNKGVQDSPTEKTTEDAPAAGTPGKQDTGAKNATPATSSSQPAENASGVGSETAISGTNAVRVGASEVSTREQEKAA